MNLPKFSLVIFAKEPREGRVKTRLQSELAPAEAVNLYRAFVQDVCAMAAKVRRVRKIIYYAGSRSPGAFLSRFKRFEFARQFGNTLGARLLGAFRREQRQGAKKTVIVGSDCLTISVSDIEDAFRQLDRYDCVLGPSTDGGYYLIGLNRPQPGIFKDIPWSTDKVFSETLSKARSAGLKVYQLPKRTDIDSPQDLKSIKTNFARSSYSHRALSRLKVG